MGRVLIKGGDVQKNLEIRLKSTNTACAPSPTEKGFYPGSALCWVELLGPEGTGE